MSRKDHPEIHKRGLLDMIQDVHMGHTGASERNPIHQSADLRLLHAKWLDWKPPIHSPAYDMAVYNLLTQVLVETQKIC